MRLKVVIVVGSLLMILALLANGCGQKDGPAARPSNWPQDIAIGCKSSGSSYIGATTLATMFQKYLPDMLAHAATGPTEAVHPAMLRKGELQLGSQMSTGFYEVLASSGEYTKAERAGPAIRTVFIGEGFYYALMARPSAQIKSLADIKGKRFMILRGGSVEREQALRGILKLYNISDKDVTVQSFSGYDEMTAAVREGRTDVAFSLVTPSAGYLQDLTTTGDAVVVPWTDEEMKNISKLIPGLSPAAFPAGSLKGQTKPINTPFTPLCWITYETVPEDLIQAMVAAVYDHFSEFSTYFAETKEWTLPAAIAPERIPGPMHNGAIKYYKDKGLWTSAHDSRQKELLAIGKR